MAKYDLTSSLETSFTFAIGDKEFTFRKPTVREMRSIAKTFSNIENEEDSDKQVELSDEAMKQLYEFVTPVNHAVYIGDLMGDQTIGVQVAFNEMIKKELGATQ